MMKNMKFGIELETCVHVLGREEFKKVSVDSNSEKVAIDVFYDCLKSKSDTLKWSRFTQPTETNYDTWIIIPDHSVECNKNAECISKNSVYCEDMQFFPVEIVTPVLIGLLGMKVFTYVYYGVLLSDNFIYARNFSQGLHINLSHPQMHLQKFINLWASIEPVIWQSLPSARRFAALPFAYPIYNDTDRVYEKFSSVHIHKGRIEIRLFEGTMEYLDIMMWLQFCMIILEQSIIIKQLPETSQDDKLGMLNTLCDLVQDSNVLRYILERYNANRESSWPEFYRETEKVIFEEIIIPENVAESLRKMSEKTC